MKPLAVALLSAGCLAAAEPGFFAGALGGIATLSADGRTVLSGSTPAAGSYKPENGPAVNIYAGWHVTGYLSLQANYVANANDVAITRIQGNESFEQRRRSRQDGFVGDALLYFRNRSSWVRPYLSAGIGPIRIHSTATGVASAAGSLPLPPREFSSVVAGFRVAVGVDLMAKSGWGFRYSFSETMSKNPFGQQLVPTGQRRLANFQNLFGFVKYFGHRS